MNIKIDRYDIVKDQEEYIFLPTNTGEWVQFSEIHAVVTELYNKMNLLNKQLTDSNNTIRAMKQHAQNSPDYITCPKCGYPQEETGMKQKECTSCEYEWYSNIGY